MHKVTAVHILFDARAIKTSYLNHEHSIADEDRHIEQKDNDRFRYRIFPLPDPPVNVYSHVLTCLWQIYYLQ
jgi:hypothetical protein